MATKLFHNELRRRTWWPLGLQMKKKNLSLRNMVGIDHLMLDCKGRPNGHQVSTWGKKNRSPRDLVAIKFPSGKKTHLKVQTFFFPT
jgi:hypothetical protein